jgi:hypothetical protein
MAILKKKQKKALAKPFRKLSKSGNRGWLAGIAALAAGGLAAKRALDMRRNREMSGIETLIPNEAERAAM